MRPILIAVLLAALGCDSTGITGNPDATSETPASSPYISRFDRGDCIEYCTPDMEDMALGYPYLYGNEHGHNARAFRKFKRECTKKKFVKKVHPIGYFYGTEKRRWYVI